MKLKKYHNLRKKCLSSFLLGLLLLSSACVRFDTIRNNNTSIWEGYDPANKKVYLGRIKLVFDGVTPPRTVFTIPRLENFLSNSRVGLFKLNSTGSSGIFAANAVGVGETAISGFFYIRGNVTTSGRLSIPIKLHEKQGLYYFGDITIRYNVQKLDSVEVINDVETMNMIANQVPEMNALEKYNIVNEVKSAVDKQYNSLIGVRKEIEKKEKDKKVIDVNKAINSF